jgi:hypothetical protein
MEVAIGQRRKSMINVNDDDNNGDGNSNNVVNSRRASFISKQNAHDDSDDNSVDDKDEDDDDGKDKNNSKDDENNNENKIKRDEELMEEYTDDHIKLDRPYMMDDIYDIDVYKVLPRIFYYQPIFYLSRQVIELYPVQKLIAIFAITQHKYTKLLERLKSNYDEENENYHNLQVSIDKVNKIKYKFLNSSRSIVQMNYGFTLQRRIYGVLKTIVLTGKDR